ncbi:MAG: Crp/Fnr family transcriptional regulator [Erysipelotrichaceae bacterium]|nr:Crp/Fnr family transcriptional regulator [Erysipelotrichaceae bacterium]
MKLSEVTKNQLKEICGTFLFENIDRKTVESILRDERVVCQQYAKGETVFKPEQYSKSLAYILKGTASISMLTADRDEFPMRRIEEGSFFGVAALFNQETRYVTEIRAAKNLKIIFFKESLVEQSIRENEEFAMNYVRFLGSRIRFLNRKISLLANSSSENSLIGYLTNAASRFGETFRLEVSYTQLARNLNMGRSSLYRALDDLENRGIITRQGRNITLLNQEALKNS